ncbi:hypothetical protein GCM10023216_15970 [Isoptericola chiayiensis]|uniref:PPM-type phosphatase domain-containing protein n=1 Tax=Isoptericola chiayiensis TaxID=579446 RepID=A0ABP8YDF7_9MICO
MRPATCPDRESVPDRADIIDPVTDWFASAVRGQECAEVAREVDWSSTALGRPSTWPGALRNAVELCFSTRFAVLLTWGPELTMIYNDGYRDMLGTELHPRAMGASAPQLWGHIWDDVGPLFDEVLRTGVPTWDVDMKLMMDRSGFTEETYFTFSYSALRDDDGAVRGVMDIATETTRQVVYRRRLETLGRLSTAFQQRLGGPDEVIRAAASVLGEATDVARVDLFPPGAPPVSVGTGMGPDRGTVDAVLSSGEPAWTDRTLVAPLDAGRGAAPSAVIAVQAAPHRPLDDEHRSFLGLLVQTVSDALARAEDHQRRVRRVTSVSDTLQLAMVPDTPASPRWVTRYRPADDTMSVGGDWFDVVDLSDGCFGLVVGDCVGHGVEAAASMGRLSSAGRALMLAGSGPARTLEMLDVFARTTPGAEFTTVFCGVVDTSAGTLTYSSAGHPPGLLVRADGGTEWLERARGVLLTLPHGGRPERTTDLAAGDTVLLYTDGLIERRGESLRTGLERLETLAARACRETPVERLPDRLLNDMLPDGSRDDVALVVYRAG